MTDKKVLMNRKSGLYLKATGRKGRGVFCTGNIKKGELLEVTPAIILNESETSHVDKTGLVRYTFMTGELSARLMKQAGAKDVDSISAVAMGMVSFCNHARDNNALVYWEEHGGTLYYILQALRDIPKGVEICTTYGEEWMQDHHPELEVA